MKGDFSRLPYAPPSATGVYLQQGRVLLDSDWNAQLAVQKRRAAQALADALGADAAPENAAGFEITPRFALPFNAAGAPPQWAAAAPPELGEAYTVELNLLPSGTPGVAMNWPGAFVLSLVTTDDGLTPQLQPAAGGPAITAPPLVAGRFCALTVVVDGPRQSLLVDGVPAGETTVAGAPAASGPVTFAAAANGGEPLACQLAEVRLWDHARSAGETQADAYARLSGHEPGLAFYLVLEPSQATGGAVAAIQPAGANVSLNGGVAGFQACDAWIGAGRYYLGGLAYENPRPLAYSGQPGRPAPTDLSSGAGWLFHLAAWERFETALDDPALRDPALGGPDTSGWTFGAWRVGALQGDGASRDAQWTALTDPARGRVAIDRRDPLASLLSNTLYRLEVHDAGVALLGTVDEAVRRVGTPVTLGAEGALLDADGLPATALVAGRGVWVWRDGDPAAVGRGVVTVSDDALSLAGLPAVLAGAGPAMAAPEASFKWSSVNGCVAFPVVGVALNPDASVIRVMLGSQGDNGFDIGPGDWVELTSDLQDAEGAPGAMFQLHDIDRQGLIVTLANPSGDPAPEIPPGARPVLRRWDTPLGTDGAPSAPAVRPISAGVRAELEAGIAATFEAGRYASGDYWAFTARDVAGGVIAWPDGGLGPRAPQGVLRCYVQLALATPQASGPQMQDLRSLFSPRLQQAPSWAPMTLSPPPPILGPVALYDAPWLTVIDGDTGIVSRVNVVAGGAWSDGPNLPGPRPQASFARLGYDIIAVGAPKGLLSGAATELLPALGGWRKGPTLAKAVANPGLGVIDGVLYALGGAEGGKVTTVVQTITPEGGAAIGALLTPRAAPCVASVGGRLFVIGGTIDGEAVQSHEGFDPASRSIRPCAPLSPGVIAVSATGWRDRVVVLGLASSGPVLLAYDPAADAWTSLPAAPAGARALFTDGAALYAWSPAAADGNVAALFRLK